MTNAIALHPAFTPSPTPTPLTPLAYDDLWQVAGGGDVTFATWVIRGAILAGGVVAVAGWAAVIGGVVYAIGH